MNSYAYTDYHHHQFDRPFLSPLPMPSPKSCWYPQRQDVQFGYSYSSPEPDPPWLHQTTEYQQSKSYKPELYSHHPPLTAAYGQPLYGYELAPVYGSEPYQLGLDPTGVQQPPHDSSYTAIQSPPGTCDTDRYPTCWDTNSQHLWVEFQPLDQSGQPPFWEPPVNRAPQGYPSNDQLPTPQQPSPAPPFVLPPYAALEPPSYSVSDTDGPSHNTRPKLHPCQPKHRSPVHALFKTSSEDILESIPKENVSLDCDQVEECFANSIMKIQDSSAGFGGIEMVEKTKESNLDYERREKHVQCRERIQLNTSRVKILQTHIVLGKFMKDDALLEILCDSSHVRDVVSMNHRSTSLDADARLVPPRHGTPYPKLHASPSWFDVSVVKELAMSKATQQQLIKADVYMAEGGTRVIVQLAGFASKLVAEEAVGGLWNLSVGEAYNGASAKATEWRHSTIPLWAKQQFGASDPGGRPRQGFRS